MENKTSFDVLVQDAVAVLNRIIVSEEMAKNSRGIVKVIRFRDWLKAIAPSDTASETQDAEDWQY